MTEQQLAGVPARLDWFSLSEDLEAVFVAARRVSALARHGAAEQTRMRSSDDPRRVREAWADFHHLLSAAASDLDAASSHLATKAVAVLGAVIDAEDRD